MQTKVGDLFEQSECRCHTCIFTSLVKRDVTKDDPEFDYRDGRLYKILNGFLWYMRFFGLFYVVRPRAGSAPRHEGRKQIEYHRKNETFWRIFSILCSTIQTACIPCILVPMGVIRRFDTFMLNHFTYLFWQTQCTCVAIVCVHVCTDSRKFAQLFRQWEEVEWCHYEREHVERGLKRRMKVFLAFGVFVNVANTLGWVLHMFGNDHSYFPPDLTDTIPEIVSVLIRVLYCTSHLFATCAWTLPFFLFVALLLSIQEILEKFNESVEKALQIKKKGQFPNPANFLFKYKRTIQMVETASSTFGLMLLIKLVLDMCITCMNTYLMLYVCYPLKTKINQVLWTSVNLSWLLYLAHVSSKINELATQAYSNLQELNFLKCPTQKLIQYTTYFYRMTGPTIGISMYGFSVLTRSTVGALLGTYFSYFILIRQFQKPVPCETALNVTTNSSTF